MIKDNNKKIYWLVYKITNIKNNKIYVGKHKTLNENDTYFGSGKLLQYAIDKYGKNNFVKEIIEKCKNLNELNTREIFWIKKLNSITPFGYNICKGGEGIDGDLIKGKNNPFYGKTHSIATKEKMSKKGKERSHIYKTPEFKKKMQEVTAGEKNGFYGKTHSEKTKSLLKNKKHSKKTKELISTKLKKYYKDPSSRKTTSNGLKNFFENNVSPCKGKPKDEETKRKISESLKKYHKFKLAKEEN